MTVRAEPIKRRVLFLCTGNSCRSQMAEAFLRNQAGDRFEVFSAGLHPRPVHPLAQQVMKEVGIDIDHQRSKSIDEIPQDKAIAFVITVCARAEKECPREFSPAAVRYSWPLVDPADAAGTHDEILDRFRQVRDEIRVRIRKWLREEVPPEWL